MLEARMSNALRTRWTEGLKRIENEQIRDLLMNRHFFKPLHERLLPHVGMHRVVNLSGWLMKSYAASIVHVRR